jgi:hypothetical protein
MGHVVVQLVEALNYNGMDYVNGNFIDIILPGPEVDSASNRNEYQEYILGLKEASVYG